MNKIEVNSRDENGVTPLMTFIHEENEEMVAAVLEIGAEVDAQAKNGLTPLMIASVVGHKGIVLMLLRAGANTQMTASGLSAAEFADQGGHSEVGRIIRTWSSRPWSK